jgi:hypothetical protein
MQQAILHTVFLRLTSVLLPLLPLQCSELIKKRGVPLSQWNPGSEEVAFDKEASLKVLEMLESSSIAVLGGDVVCIMQNQLKYVYAPWECKRNIGELPLEYAKRSRDMAFKYVQNFRPAKEYQPLFVLVLQALIAQK